MKSGKSRRTRWSHGGGVIRGVCCGSVCQAEVGNHFQQADKEGPQSSCHILPCNEYPPDLGHYWQLFSQKPVWAEEHQCKNSQLWQLCLSLILGACAWEQLRKVKILDRISQCPLSLLDLDIIFKPVFHNSWNLWSSHRVCSIQPLPPFPEQTYLPLLFTPQLWQFVWDRLFKSSLQLSWLKFHSFTLTS